MTVIVKKDNGQSIVFTENPPNIKENFANKTFWQQQSVYTYHRPYQANNGIIYHDGKHSAECVIRGVCAYNKNNLLLLESLKGTILRVTLIHPRTGVILEEETRGYVRNIPQPSPEVGENITFNIELTKVY